MNRIIILSFLISLLLFSCNSGKREIYLSCKNAEGISTKTELTVNGFQTGHYHFAPTEKLFSCEIKKIKL